MNKASLVLGAVLIVVALILGGVQVLRIYDLRGSSENRWYFCGAIGAIGLAGIILAAWSLL
jgi:hypothetical protein